jgi:hypothetical protein
MPALQVFTPTGTKVCWSSMLLITQPNLAATLGCAGLSREPSHSRAESESERVLRHVLAPLPHLNALDVPVLSCSDVQVIAGQLPRLESLTLRLGPQQGVSSSAGELKLSLPYMTVVPVAQQAAAPGYLNVQRPATSGTPASAQ